MASTILTTQDFLDEGADQILATGSKVIKLQLTPKRYPWNSDWPKGSDSLAQLAQMPYFKSVFSKSFNTYILTAYSLGRPEHYWTAGITAEQAADETRQFYELSKYLLTAYHGHRQDLCPAALGRRLGHAPRCPEAI